MVSLGITGGIASGKSTACELLAVFLNCKSVSADQIVHDLLENDPATRDALVRRFGPDCTSCEGKLDRSRLRDIIFRDPTARKDLEAVLHPRVRSTWLEALARERQKGSDYFLVEIPLLFEVNAQKELDQTIVIACSENIQRQRITARRKLSEAEAQRIIDSQMPVYRKIKLADHVIWNDGDLPTLTKQVLQLAKSLSHTKDFPLK